jgi:hypothetical protein
LVKARAFDFGSPTLDLIIKVADLNNSLKNAFYLRINVVSECSCRRDNSKIVKKSQTEVFLYSLEPFDQFYQFNSPLI